MCSFLYLIKTYKHWIKYSDKSYVVFISLFIHSMWIKIIPGKLNLNKVYMDNNQTILQENDWKLLWFLAIFGHIFIFYLNIHKNYKILITNKWKLNITNQNILNDRSIQNNLINDFKNLKIDKPMNDTSKENITDNINKQNHNALHKYNDIKWLTGC